MRRNLPYILAVLVFALLALMLISTAKKRPRKMDTRISLRHSEKIPYGYYAAHHLLPQLFSRARLYTDKQAPGRWDSLSRKEGGQVAILVANDFNADEEELNSLLRFAEQGNQVFIICSYMSYEARNFFNLWVNDFWANRNESSSRDSLQVSLTVPRFKDSSAYVYPGLRHAGAFSRLDTPRTVVLGRDREERPNFIQLKKGAGAMYVHLAPLAFSNYFLLHKNNSLYFQQAFSVLPPGTRKIVWNEFYLTKRNRQPESEPNWLGVLFRFEAFRWALLTALGTGLLLVLLEMRRKQRVIPPVKKPVNDSLDFVKTIGRLYYDQKDHKDLANKMVAHFLDHVRHHYKLGTTTLDEEFVQALHHKSGYPVEELKSLIHFIYFIQTSNGINEQQLNRFYNSLEAFYQTT